MRSLAEPRDLALTFNGIEPVESLVAPPQKIELWQHPKLGHVLVIQDEVQHAEAWHALYHEPLVHLAASFVPTVNQVLILGGGSLFAAAEVLKYPSVERCVLVDHDPRVLQLISRHYAHGARVIADPRFKYEPCDALEFLSTEAAKFDLIVNDCFDSVAVSASAGISAHNLMTSRLSMDGVCSDLIYRHLLESDHQSHTRKVLDNTQPYALSLLFVPEYPGILHLLTMWGSAHVTQTATIPRNEVQLAWRSGLDRPELEFFNPDFLSFHLYLPPYVRRIWGPFTK